MGKPNCLCGTEMNLLIENEEYIIWKCPCLGCGRLMCQSKHDNKRYWYRYQAWDEGFLPEMEVMSKKGERNMDPSQSATVRQFRQVLIETQHLLALDGRTKEARRKQAQRRLLISVATDDELEQMAKMSAELFPYSVEQILNDLKAEREAHRQTKESWGKDLGKRQK